MSWFLSVIAAYVARNAINGFGMLDDVALAGSKVALTILGCAFPHSALHLQTGAGSATLSQRDSNDALTQAYDPCIPDLNYDTSNAGVGSFIDMRRRHRGQQAPAPA